jgi:hypothetical protein
MDDFVIISYTYLYILYASRGIDPGIRVQGVHASYMMPYMRFYNQTFL